MKDKHTMYNEVRDYVVSRQQASITDLQRHFRIAYNQAAFLMQNLIDDGVVKADSKGGITVLVQPGLNAGANLVPNKLQFDKACDVEQLMDDLKCKGDRVTQQSIIDRIEQVDFQTVVLAGQKMMFCGIRMVGGFVAVGKPATCIDPNNWRDEIGAKISMDNTFDTLWQLEAYRKLGGAQ